MVKLSIDNKQIEVAEGSTVLSAAGKLGIQIPTMCWYEGQDHFTSCMVCVVEDTSSGKLLPACSTRVEEGMVIETAGLRVRNARKTALELLLSEHVGDCEGMCRQACPAHMNIPLMLRHLEAGNKREALKTVKDRLALPAVLGRVCSAPCEKGCRRGQVDRSLSICLIHRVLAERDLASGSPYIPQRKPVTGKTVAIVGAGPAGLSAAYYLQKEGYDCTVFDDHTQPGGMLRYEIPAQRLPRIILDSEINITRRLGAVFRMGVEVGVDVPLEKLEEEFDAVILATGTLPPREWDRPGIFICGGAVKRVSMAVKSAARGRATAFLVSRFLARKEQSVNSGPEFHSRVGKLKEGEVDEFFKILDRSEGTHLLNGCSAEHITAEAKRCLHCECGKADSCKLRRFAGEYQAAPHRFNGNGRKRLEKVLYPAGVVHEPGKCIKCGLCVRITQKYGEPLGFTFIGRGFAVKVGMPVNGNSHKASARIAALCVEACPTGALSIARPHEGDGLRGRGIER